MSVRVLAILSTLLLSTSCTFGGSRSGARPDTPTAHTAERPAREVRRDSVHRRSGRRVEQTRLQPRIMPIHDRYHPLIASDAMGSISVGTVTEGYLARAVEVPIEGEHHAVLQRIRKRHTHFTSDEMRDLLMCVADRVAARHPQHKLLLGNLSRRAGGDIPWSVSHNNGRDADIAFLSRRPDGKVATPDFLYRFGRKLEATDSPEPLIFDVAANWTLVKALIQCPKTVPVQKLFIARWLRYPILRYARAAKEPAELRYAAAAMMRQPRRASPHSDHLHLRIGCAADDKAEGCLDRGRAPDQAIGQRREVQARLPAIRAALGATDATSRAGAAYLVGLYHDLASAPALLQLLGDGDTDVRIRAAQALARIAPAATPPGVNAARHIDAALGRARTVRAGLAFSRALTSLGATAQLAARVRDGRTLKGERGRADTPVRLIALEMLAETEDVASAADVVPLIADADPAVRRQAHRTLGRLVNRSTADLVLKFGGGFAQDGVSASVPLEPAEQVVLWRRFLATVPADATREQVVLDGFRDRGLPIGSLDRDNLNSLAIALSWGAPYRDNAARAIARAIDYHPELGRGSRAHPRAFWLPFLGRRRMIDREVVARGVMAVDTLLAASIAPGIAAEGAEGRGSAHEGPGTAHAHATHQH